MKEKHLDLHNIDIAILTGDEPIEVSTLANPYYASALCKAYNDYMIDYWIPKDPRFYGSIVVAPMIRLVQLKRLDVWVVMNE